MDKHGVGRVVSLLGPDTPHRNFDGIASHEHLKLTFHDVVEMMDGFSAPKATDAEKLIGFIETWDQKQPMLIHCWAGISRSTAAAYITTCLLNPERDEAEIANTLRAASPSATPNARLISVADEILGRNGRMVEAISAIGRGADAFEGTPFRMNLVS